MSIPPPCQPSPLTGALEDYLETILVLVRDRGFARVRDIARARGVKAGSVSPALRRLADLDLVTYTQREYIGLTRSGETEARRVLARHTLLTRFFTDVLCMGQDAAADEACLMEHSLSPEGMDRLTRLFEFLRLCPENDGQWLERFRGCPRVQQGTGAGSPACESGLRCREEAADKPMSLAQLKPGQSGLIRQIRAKGPARQRLLDMGLLPDAIVQVERVAPTGDPVWVSLEGLHVALRKSEAAFVQVART